MSIWHQAALRKTIKRFLLWQINESQLHGRASTNQNSVSKLLVDSTWLNNKTNSIFPTFFFQKTHLNNLFLDFVIKLTNLAMETNKMYIILAVLSTFCIVNGKWILRWLLMGVAIKRLVWFSRILHWTCLK